MKYIIIDWMSTVCFKGIEFDDFEDAWGFIREQHPDEEDWQEYSVVEKKNIRESKYFDPNDIRNSEKA